MLRVVSLSALLLLTAVAPSGVLVVRSQPGVEVIWEGVNLGSTDRQGRLVIRDIPPGEYSVVLSKSGYRQFGTRIAIGGGETTLRRQLERLEPKPAPRPTEEPVRPPATLPPAPAERHAPGRPAGGDAAAEPDESPSPPAGRTAEPPTLPSEEATVTHSPEPDSEGVGGHREEGAGDAGLGRRLLYLSLAALLAGAIVYMLRVSGRPARELPVRAAARTKPTQVEADPVAEEPAVPAESFLSDLRQREETISSATRIVDGRQVVEVEVTDVQILDEET